MAYTFLLSEYAANMYSNVMPILEFWP